MPSVERENCLPGEQFAQQRTSVALLYALGYLSQDVCWFEPLKKLSI